jgi:L-aminopeptidase/D-esterase-like protein
MRVLVAEDHERLARAVAAGLRRYGIVVDVPLDGDATLGRLGASRYDAAMRSHPRRPGRPAAAGRGTGRLPAARRGVNSDA